MYKNASASKFLATYCAACGGPLIDAISVDTGIGPICRREFGLLDASFTDEARHQANCIVYKVAVEQSEASFLEGAEKLHGLGFEVLARKILARSKKFKAEQCAAVVAEEPSIFIENHGADMVVRTPRRDEALLAWRTIPGRRWDWNLKANLIPVASKRALWDLLIHYYPGEVGFGIKGRFVVPRRRAMSAPVRTPEEDIRDLLYCAWKYSDKPHQLYSAIL